MLSENNKFVNYRISSDRLGKSILLVFQSLKARHILNRLGLVTHCLPFPCFSGKYRIHGKKIIPTSRPFPIFQMN